MTDWPDNMPAADWVSHDEAVRLHCADSMTLLPQLPAGCVDAVVTDPPYGIDYQSQHRKDKSLWKPKIANDKAPFVWFLLPAFCVATEPASCLCFCRWDVQEPFRSAMGWAGWDVKSQVVWDRECHGMGDLNGSPAPMHDIIWFATKGDYTFHGTRPKSVVRSMRLSGEQLQHPNEKPIGLMANLVSDYCRADSLVLDPFLGSGTTAVACIKTGRRCIGIECDRRYFDIAVRRCQEAYADAGLFNGVIA